MIIQIKVQKSCVASEIYSFVSFNYISSSYITKSSLGAGYMYHVLFVDAWLPVAPTKYTWALLLMGSSLILYKYHHSTVKLNVFLVKSGPLSSLLATKTRPLGSLLAARSGQKVPPQGQFWSPKVGPGGQF